MADFLYEARNSSGKVVQGAIKAENADAAAGRLRGQGLSSITVKRKPIEINIQFKRSASSKDLKTFTRQFATMIDAGLPLVQCLEILGTQSENKWFGARLLEVKTIVEGGATFSEALAKYPRIFDNLFVSLVAAGEIGGILDTIMKRLAEYIEKKERLERRIKGAMVYPIGLMVVTVVIVFVLLKWVIPTFEQMFSDVGSGGLPGPTAFVVGLSRSFASSWYLWVGGVVGFVVGFTAFSRSRAGKQVLHRLYLQLPVIGPVIRKIAVARFTRTMGTLLSSGVPILDALNTVAKTAGNVVIEKAIRYSRDRISEGRNISEPLHESKVFPGMVVQMIAVGEQTGALDVMCNKIADFYDEEVDVAVAAITSLIEPLMMVVIGGLVGGMLISMYLPIFELAGTVAE
jgi:type IV pilus assembly protein PilC